MTVLCIKLANGDEIIGRHVEKAEGELNDGTAVITLKQVRQVIIQQVAEGQFAPALMPWIISNADIEVEINLNLHGLALFKPQLTIEQSYMEQTGGIKQVKKSLIKLT